MVDHYVVLGVSPQAKQEEVQAAFDELLVVRKARRQKTSDLHAAMAVLGEPTLRRAYDLARIGQSTKGKLVHATVVTSEFARDNIPEIDIRELLSQTREVALKLTVVGSGTLARVAEFTAKTSRTVQLVASRRLDIES